MLAKVGRAAGLALALTGWGCSRDFAPPPTSVPNAAPELDSVSPATAFAGQVITLAGARFVPGPSAPALDQVHFGTATAQVLADGGPTELAVVVPELGSNPSSVAVGISVNGLPAPGGLTFLYRGPGHPVGFIASEASDLSPTPGPLAVAHGIQATTLARHILDALYLPGSQLDVPFAPSPLSTPAEAAAFVGEGQGGGAWFVSTSFLAGTGSAASLSVLEVAVDPQGIPASSLVGLCNVGNPAAVVPTSRGLLLLLPPGSDPGLSSDCATALGGGPPGDAGMGVMVSVVGESDRVIASAAALGGNGEQGLIAALTACDGGQETCLAIWSLAADGGSTATAAYTFDGSDGLLGTSVAFAPDGGQVFIGYATESATGSASYTLELDLNDGQFSLRALPDGGEAGYAVIPGSSQLLRTGLAASPGRVATLVVSPPSLLLSSWRDSSVIEVPLPGPPSAVAVDPVAPNHFYVAVASPPAVLEFDDSGVQYATRTLSADLSELSFSPSGQRVAAAFDRLPALVVLDSSTLSLPAPSGVETVFGAPFQGGAPPGYQEFPLMSQALWVGEAVLCGLSQEDDGAEVVRCGEADALAISELGLIDGGPSPCVLPTAATPGPVVLRFDPPDGVVVYSGSQVTRYAVDVDWDAGVDGVAAIACSPGAPSPPGQLQPGWTSLSVSADGSGGVEVVPGEGLVLFFADGGSFPICQAGQGCPDLSTISDVEVDPLSQILSITVSAYTELATPSNPPVLIDLAGDHALCEAFSPDSSRLYLGTELGRVYEFDTAGAYPPADGGSPFLVPLRTAVTGFAVRKIVVDPSGSRLLLFGYNSDQLWAVE